MKRFGMWTERIVLWYLMTGPAFMAALLHHIKYTVIDYVYNAFI